MVQPDRLLTGAELEIMQVLWKRGSGTVNDVREEFAKPSAYTTIATLLRILEQKGFVSSEKIGKSLCYTPMLEKKAYETRSAQRLVAQVFEGAPLALAKQLLQAETFTAGDLKELKRLVEERLK